MRAFLLSLLFLGLTFQVASAKDFYRADVNMTLIHKHIDHGTNRLETVPAEVRYASDKSICFIRVDWKKFPCIAHGDTHRTKYQIKISVENMKELLTFSYNSILRNVIDDMKIVQGYFLYWYSNDTNQNIRRTILNMADPSEFYVLEFEGLPGEVL